MTGHGNSYGREFQLQCPKDATQMRKVSDPRGVTIDECPTCGTVVLDAGELQRIVNVVASAPGFRPQPAAHFTGGQHHSGGYHGHQRHKDGFFGDLFD
jgi:Zn-finger nucleic acid-binding protein